MNKGPFGFNDWIEFDDWAWDDKNKWYCEKQPPIDLTPRLRKLIEDKKRANMCPYERDFWEAMDKVK